jgi:hypothetical protein
MPYLAYRVFRIVGAKWLLLISGEWLQRAREPCRREQRTAVCGSAIDSEDTGQ